MIVLFSIVLAALVVSGSGGTSIDSHCFDCIFYAISRGTCSSKMGCDKHGFCGPFRINWNYWDKAGRITKENDTNPVAAWTRCVGDIKCATRVIQEYMNRHAEDCNKNGEMDCEDFAQIHQLGRCSEFPNIDYLLNFTDCFNNLQYHQINGYPMIQYENSRFDSSVQHEPPQLIPITNYCLGCICQASFGNFCPSETGCEDGKCGAFRIDRAYWIDAGRITLNNENSNATGAFERCATNTMCASRVVQGFMNRFALDCDLDGAIDCKDYARIHSLGGCLGKLNIEYEAKFEACAADVKRRTFTVRVSSPKS